MSSASRPPVSSRITRHSSLATYKRELLKWNEKINLIGPEAREHLDDHIAEALAAAETLEPEGEVLDFGSGGGLPAIPMAIVSPKARFHLVEADQKKWAFLKHVARECGLNAVVTKSSTSMLICANSQTGPRLSLPAIKSRMAIA